MYTKSLVITDNIFLALEFEKIIKDLKLEYTYSFSFAISPFSSIENFKNELSHDVEVVNLKANTTVKKIIESFDLVFSIHCKQLFPSTLVENVKCINVHPGYNPINRGWYPQVFSIIEGKPIGATIHEIDIELDHGRIISREFVPIYAWDTSKDVYERVVECEIKLLRNNIKDILNGTYNTFEPEEEGKLYLKKDFNSLLKINLSEKDTFQSFINKLRALSHGEYKNAYFIDPISHKKVFINIKLTVEDGIN